MVSALASVAAVEWDLAPEYSVERTNSLRCTGKRSHVIAVRFRSQGAEAHSTIGGEG